MRTLLVSADLTADDISAIGGHRRFVPNQGPEAPGPAFAEVTSLVRHDLFPLFLESEIANLRRCASGPAAESRLPGRFASGESQEKSPGESSLSPGIFRAFLGQKPLTFRNPKSNGESCWFYPTRQFRLLESRGRSPLAQVWARGAPSVPLTAKSTLIFSGKYAKIT
jgi:hypothetical protein